MAGELRIAFFGLPLAAHLLLHDGHHVAFAVLAPYEQLPGRRRVRRALGDARVLEAAELGDELDLAVERAFAQGPVDLLVSWFWPRLLPQAWLGRPRCGALGAHPSLLPRHRGRNPYFWTIDSGDERAGVTVHELSAAYDEGAVLARAAIATGERNSWQLARALDRPSLALLRQVVGQFARGEPPRAEPQDPGGATLAPEPSGDALRVDWTWPSERIARRVRALSPVPGLALEIRGVSLFVTEVVPTENYPRALHAGEAATLGEPPAELVIRTGNGAVRVQRAALAPEHELADQAEPRPLSADELAALIAAQAHSA